MFLWKHFYNSVNEFDMEIENVDLYDQTKGSRSN